MAVSYNKLWKILIDKKMNKGDLRTVAGVSWSAVTKMSKDEKVSMEVIIKVCTALNCNVGDIMDIIPEQAAASNEIKTGDK
ncbi:transcriptional regulator [Clostridia bacterium]|nr:transcriptional regulator [Clostridia bacterium]